jgi:prevent-host-death family protein
MKYDVIGVRELKTRLGTYLRRVRTGRTIVVTDRGEPVAELRPLPAGDAVPAALLELSHAHAVTLPVRAAMVAFRPIRSRGGSLSEALIENREDCV